MKNIIIKLVLVVCMFPLLSGKPVTECKCKNIPLYGRVQVVEHHADFDVRIVSSHADIHVKKVASHPNNCGEWRFVNSHPDFTIRFVDSHEDFSIKYVDSHAGMP